MQIVEIINSTFKTLVLNTKNPQNEAMVKAITKGSS